jgi:hypothetical protein
MSTLDPVDAETLWYSLVDHAAAARAHQLVNSGASRVSVSARDAQTAPSRAIATSPANQRGPDAKTRP